MKINKYDLNYLVRMIQRGEDLEKIHYAFKENEDYNKKELDKYIVDLQTKG